MTLRVYATDIFSGDAVGNHCLGLARTASRLGLDVELYARFFDVSTAGVKPLEELFTSVTENDVVLLSYSIFDPYLDKLLALNCRETICYFHGVTDPMLLRELEPPTAKLCEQALAQLPSLAGFDTIIANSHCTAASLAGALDVQAVKVVPPVFADMPVFKREIDPDIEGPRTPNLLMVGRVVPHKRIEDGISILALLKEHEFDATLSIVGSSPNYDYLKLLINHARRLAVLERVDFKGMLDDADLFECYETTDALLATSRHEGFCVPVLEAMRFGKPVFVRGGTAAEEISPTDCVFPANADLSAWASAIARRLGKSTARGRSDPAYVAHADEVLQRASDAVWRELLANADVLRRKA
ncbi:glycosyltransferase family 4 protein [Paraburkholderia sp. MM5477-R1]|uniref:glycosyltransferase family 4 protein n=1 Tax=Paraburkholderia sp. MM5477-R1 TaxID=2991062 RepID=UPI003D1E6572